MPAKQQKTLETKKTEQLLRKHFARVDAYRYNPASIRVRIIDPSFSGRAKEDREGLVLPLIRSLPEEIQADIVVLLMLAPGEEPRSLMNMEFESPSPSLL